MRKIIAAAIVSALTAAWAVRAGAAELKPEELAARVGQTFAGYQDFWAWVTQRFQSEDGKVTEMRGRVYYKREKMFRLNFGQPPFLVDGTDGDVYWRYHEKDNLVEYTKLDEHAPVHILFQVFAAGNQMVRALDKFFNIEGPVDKLPFGPDKEPTYKLVLSLKADKLKEMRDAGNQLAPPATFKLTFWVDPKKFEPKRVEVDWGKNRLDTFDLETFNTDRGLSDKLFQMPRPEGAKIQEMKKN